MASNNPVKLAFNSFDPPGGGSDMPPVIFMHHITSTKENWNNIPQTVANATKRKAYAFDARNHGDSEWRDVINLDCMVEDLLHFMDSLKIKRAILIGHLMGGIIGLKTALKEPERVEKLVVEDMLVKRIPRAPCNLILVLLDLAKEALQQVPEGANEETAKKFIVDTMYKNLPAEIVAKMVSKIKWTDIDLKRTEGGRYSFKFNVDAIGHMLKNVDETFADSKETFKGPTCFLYGGLSPFLVREEVEVIKKFFPNAELVEFANATHKVHSDSPKEFTEALVKFLLKE